MLKSTQVTTKSRIPLGQNTFGFCGDGVGYQPTTTSKPAEAFLDQSIAGQAAADDPERHQG